MAREGTTVTSKKHLFRLIALCPGYFQRGLVQMLVGKTTAITDLLFLAIVSSRARELDHYFRRRTIQRNETTREARENRNGSIARTVNFIFPRDVIV